MWELSRMAARLDPQTWGWVKIVFIVLGIVTYAGIRLRRHTAVHVAMEIGAFIGLGIIFLYGVFTRGVLGTAASEPHTAPYYAVLIVHVTAGMVYALTAIVLMVLGYLILVQKRKHLLRIHAVLGRVAEYSLYTSVVLALPL